MSEPLTREQVMENLKPECNYLLYGQCQSHGCLTRGGWRKGPTEGFEATCHTRQQADTDAALRARVRELEQQWHLAATHDADMDYVQTISALTQAHQQAVDDFKEVQEGKQRLIRKLDVMWNGETGAAKQASLCDMVCQIGTELPKLKAQLQQAVEALKGCVAAWEHEGEPNAIGYEVAVTKAKAVLATRKEKG